MPEPLPDPGPTSALRNRSHDALTTSLAAMLAEGRAEWMKDERDLQVAMAPYHDCAQRLGLDPAELFEQAAEMAPSEIAESVRAFGRRTDVSPGAFGFRVKGDRYFKEAAGWNPEDELAGFLDDQPEPR